MKNLTNLLGMTGLVAINQNLSRMPLYQLYGLDEQYEQTSLMNLSFADGTTVAVNFRIIFCLFSCSLPRFSERISKIRKFPKHGLNA